MCSLQLHITIFRNNYKNGLDVGYENLDLKSLINKGFFKNLV